MYSDEFEAAFSAFLDSNQCDETENHIFAIMRIAFAAGWKAAGGDEPQKKKFGILVK